MRITGPLVLAVAASTCLAGLAGAAEEGDLRGVWKPQRYVATLRTADGQLPPLLPQGAALYQQRVDARREQRPLEAGDPVELCQPAGTPRLLYQMRPFMLVQTPLKVTFVHEFQHMVRNVYLDEPLEFADITWQGTSVGHWDNGALVIETGGFNGRTWLDEAGLPHSDQLKVTERYQRSGKSTMEVEITVEDPVYYAAPWSTRLKFNRIPDGNLGWHVCTQKMFPMPADARPGPPAG